MKITIKSAFTLIELLVVITIIAILASIAVPVFNGVLIKANQSKALSNAKQIALALKMYSADNNGYYPSYTIQNGVAGTTTVGSSNEAFAQLFPNYIQQEAIFWLSKSGWCSNTPPNEIQDAPTAGTWNLTLAKGENEWAYVLELNDSVNPGVPLLADGFVNGGNPLADGAQVYTINQNSPGGVWKGQKAIVVHADYSGNLVNLIGSGTLPYGIVGPNGGATNGNVFTTANGNNGWLGTGNVTVNPLAPQ